MNSCIAKRFILLALTSITACNSPGNGESSANSGRALINGNFAIAYVKRPTDSLGNPTDGITFHAGGDLYIRDLSAPGAEEHNITSSHTLGAGDVSDPEVSFDGKKIIFAMKGPSDATWDLWEYDIPSANLHAFMTDQREADLGDDVDPTYLPDGRVVFSSTRQSRSKQLQNVAGVEPFSYVDEYEREPAIVLHTIDSTGTSIRQISFNQSHDRNPTVLASGEIIFSRWDHLGSRNQFSIFKTNPDGTNLFVYYGAHSPGNSFLQPREMPNGRLLSTLMPLSGTGEGGALVTIDVANYSEEDQPAPGVATGGHGQVQVTAEEIPLDRSFSQYGRFTAPYPLWDGTNRALVSWSPAHAVDQTNPLTGQPEKAEGTATYGVYMLDMDARTMRAIVTVPENVVVTDAVALMARPTPNIVTDKELDPLLVLDNLGILNVKSVYDTDSLERMGAAVLASDDSESIPLTTAPANDPRSQVADIARLKDPTRTTAAQRPARFVRVTKAVATPAGLSRETIGETEFEMQQLVGYAEVEPDGSFKIKVPADTPLSLAILDSNGRAFTPHTSWLQVRPGETRTCNGCHSPRRGSPINIDPIAGAHAELFGSNTEGTIHVHPGASVNSALHAVDPEGDPLTYSIVGAPSKGTVIITNANTGTFIYTANTNAAIGLDTFTWRATDNHGNQSNVATITVTIHEPPMATSGESMAETRVRTYPTVANLLADISYQDVWGDRTNPCINVRYTGNTDCVGAATPLQDLTTTAPSSGVINYIDHIQPLFSKNRGVNSCTRCHKNDDLTDPESAGLDLTTTTTGAGRYASYQALLVGRPILDANGQPTIEMVDGVPEVQRNTPLVVPGAARSSYFIEKIFEHELRADKTLTTSVNHSDWLNSAEKRLLTEWIDLGAQYYNDPFGPDTNGNGVKNLSEVRNAITGLDTTVFTEAVHPILVNRCAGCHQPFVIADGQSSANANFVGNRFILTGNAAGDLNVTIGMINDLAHPANSYLLTRPTSNNVSPNPIHPQTTNASGLQAPILSPDNPADATVPADYQTIYDWINAARVANGL